MLDINKALLKLSDIKKQSMPKHFKPQLAYLVDKTPVGEDWIHEIKYDGYRIVCFINNGEITLLSRNGKDYTNVFPTLLPGLQHMALKNAILDGEVVSVESGKMSFQNLQYSIKHPSENIQYFIFDIMYCNGYDLTSVSLFKRKNFLKVLLRHSEKDKICFSDYIKGNGLEVYQEVCKKSLEGLISKKIDSIYEQKRSYSWVKSKCGKRQEFIIGGFTKPKGSRKFFGAILIGQYNEKKQLVYCGKVGTGFSDQFLQEYYKKFCRLAKQESPFIDNTLIENKKEITWLKPKLVCEIKFTEFTKDGLLRHPSFQGLRVDKNPQDVHRENEMHDISGVSITHPNEIIYPKHDITKEQVIHYYDSISDHILPYIVNRPLSILRCPGGYGTECFFQKHFHEKSSKQLYTIAIKGDKKDYFFIKDKIGLLTLINLGAIELHPWGSQCDKIEKPDRIVFDLDPDPAVPLNVLIKAALFIKNALSEYNLNSYVKTTGGKGFHVVIPIVPKLEWPDVKIVCKRFAEKMAIFFPELFIANMSKSKRKNKIYIDYLRNGRGATSVAPYSTRARENASISMPISWEALGKIKSVDYYTIFNIQKSMGLKKNAWGNFFKEKQSISKTLFK